MKGLIRLIAEIANKKRLNYTKSTSNTINSNPANPGKKDQQKEAVNVTEFINKIENINLPPHQLRAFGLSEGWQKRVSKKYIEKVVITAERYKKDLRELSKR